MPKEKLEFSQFNFKVNSNSDAGEWLKNQRNKTLSMEYLIEWAISKIGKGDLIDASVKMALINNDTQIITDIHDEDKPSISPPIEVAVPEETIVKTEAEPQPTLPPATKPVTPVKKQQTKKTIPAMSMMLD